MDIEPTTTKFLFQAHNPAAAGSFGSNPTPATSLRERPGHLAGPFSLRLARPAMYYGYIISSLSRPDQRYVGFTASKVDLWLADTIEL